MGTILQEAIAAAPPTCSARTGEAPGEWPGVPLYCHVKVGLRRYVDIHGATQFYCARPTHERAVRSRYPEARPSGDPFTPAQHREMLRQNAPLMGVIYDVAHPEARAELERGTATFDAPGCYFCGRTAPILDGLYTAIDFGGDIGIQHVCDDCRERADEELELDFDNREGQPEFNGAFR